MEHLYTVAFLAQRMENGVVISSICSGLLKATSLEEAIGKAFIISNHHIYRKDDGYYNNNFSVYCITDEEDAKKVAKLFSEPVIFIDDWHEVIE